MTELREPMVCDAYVLFGPKPPSDLNALNAALSDPDSIDAHRVYCDKVEEHTRHWVYANGQMYGFDGEFASVFS